MSATSEDLCDIKFDPRPLGIIVILAGLSAGYVLAYLPKLQAANAARARAEPKHRRPAPIPPPG